MPMRKPSFFTGSSRSNILPGFGFTAVPPWENQEIASRTVIRGLAGGESGGKREEHATQAEKEFCKLLDKALSPQGPRKPLPFPEVPARPSVAANEEEPPRKQRRETECLEEKKKQDFAGQETRSGGIGVSSFDTGQDNDDPELPEILQDFFFAFQLSSFVAEKSFAEFRR